MAKAKKTTKPALTLDSVKTLVIIAMFSDDDFMEQFVLKGGNALDIVHAVSTRASLDVDLSMPADFPPDALASVRDRVERTLRSTFRGVGYEAFDVKMHESPENMSSELADFWGGYGIEFKLIAVDLFAKFAGDIEQLRRNAMMLGAKGKFTIDLSRYEYTEGKQAVDLNGFRVYVYSPAMLVCEKLRAICQQMPEYGPVIRRSRPGAPRAKDYVDIHAVIARFRLAMDDVANTALLNRVFLAKRVPITLLGELAKYREFHRSDFRSVEDTVKQGVRLESYDYYADYVERLAILLLARMNGASV